MGLADTTGAFDAAFRLVHDQYVARGYMSPRASGRRVIPHHALPSTKVFVARVRDHVVGTVTLIPDSPLGLPMDDIYRAELAPLRAAGRRVAEVSALAMDGMHRLTGTAILMRLIRALLVYAMEICRAHDLCIAVNPRHVDFYRGLLQFEFLGPLKGYRKVNGAPAIALRLDLDDVRALRARAPVEELNEIQSFFLEPRHYAQLLARLWQDLPYSGLTRAQFDEFFAVSGELEHMSAVDRMVVEALYAGRAAAVPRPASFPAARAVV